MNALLAHIKSLNAETLAWVAEDPANRWSLTVTEDMSHWAELGVFTVEDYLHYNKKMALWDGYKEANGIRPRHLDLDGMSDADLDAELDMLCAARRSEEEHLAHLDRLAEEDRRLAVMENPAALPYEEWDR